MESRIAIIGIIVEDIDASSKVIVRSIYKGLNARKVTNHPLPPIALPIED